MNRIPSLTASAVLRLHPHRAALLLCGSWLIGAAGTAAGAATCLPAHQAQVQAAGADLGPIDIFPAPGGPALQLTDCNSDGVTDLLVPHKQGSSPPRIHFADACSGSAPTKVSITFTSDDIFWDVIYVDGTSSTTFTLVSAAPQQVTFASAVGIREVVIAEGPDVCIHEICFECPVAQADGFRRGDANSDDTVDLSDGLWTLNHLFSGKVELACEDAADFNDDGSVNIADAIATFVYLFGGHRPPPAPGDECGRDPTEDRLAPCRPTSCGPVPTGER
jgi:hypothetical protein